MVEDLHDRNIADFVHFLLNYLFIRLDIQINHEIARLCLEFIEMKIVGKSFIVSLAGALHSQDGHELGNRNVRREDVDWRMPVVAEGRFGMVRFAQKIRNLRIC